MVEDLAGLSGDNLKEMVPQIGPRNRIRVGILKWVSNNNTHSQPSDRSDKSSDFSDESSRKFVQYLCYNVLLYHLISWHYLLFQRH